MACRWLHDAEYGYSFHMVKLDNGKAKGDRYGGHTTVRGYEIHYWVTG